jgi:hypothetical protein
MTQETLDAKANVQLAEASEILKIAEALRQ